MRILVIVLVAALVACSGGTRKIITPKVPQNGDATARQRFKDAQAKFLRDGHNREDFERIVEEFPQDPIVPWAKLYAGIAAVRDRNIKAATASLTEVIEANANRDLTVRAELYLGIAKNYGGDPGALPYLLRGKAGIENDDERTEWLAAVAYAQASSPQPLAALASFDELYPRVTPTERALIVARVEEVVAAAPPELLTKVFDDLANRKGPSMAAVASRLALVAEQNGQADRGAKFREVAGPARAYVGLPRTIAASAAAAAPMAGTTGLIGAVVPLGSSSQRLAESAIAGLAVASGLGATAGGAVVEVRSGVDAATAEVAVDELGRANVIAIVGPIDGASVDAAARRAESLGVPLLSLATRPEGRPATRHVFHVRHSAEARARTLARTAIGKGVKKFAVLRPDNGYGKSVAEAFVEAVRKEGGELVNTVTYPPDKKSYAEYPAKLGGGWDALFIPDNADRLELVIPAVTAAKHIPQPIGTKKVPGGRPIVLLTVAEGLAPKHLSAFARHTEGALLAPGYYPDDQDPAQKVFVDKYIATYGAPPGATEAYAYDAAQLAATGSTGRTALAAALAHATVSGVTGAIAFDANHLRSDPGVVYTVLNDGGSYQIRVAK
ncbi:MAG: penicillin-binding protein activator [Deltaproteobacteria bacterium]|nr:penicillin-binding protein activator [Deltaproteobacteria bacterium]MCW5805918.1 penicillin-binding protein activator [Deltaproteobacteria bacterium]